MAQEDKLAGARNVFALHFAYMDSVAQEIGVDKAAELSVKVDESMGAMRGKMIKDQAGDVTFNAKTAAAAARKSIEEDFGIISKVVEEDSNSVVVQCGRCPIYDAGLMTGMDAAEIEMNCCEGGIAYMNAMVKQLNPDLRYELRSFRASADGFCEEAVVMA